MTAPTAPPTVAVGDTLPELRIEATPTFIVSTALATRDFQDVHHDRDLAQAKGSKDIFVNILTDTGLVGRFVTDWAGQRAQIRSITLRLGVPWYAYDAMVMTGTVTALDAGVATVDVVGTNALGKHVTSTVTVVLDRTAQDAS
ncbi:MaoC family dehydratase [uncultured Williamsia sp.]|uniref:MaoC family dehydratase n=1 Tax=uncultured Williamsia sp. TaxID=259311 RepID=UPI002625B5F9|nr:MaoC family dehydratase [uncultured Williamsia sp.]